MKPLIALLAFIIAAQDVTIRVEVELQQIVAVVRDASGKIVTGLRQQDFVIEEDGKPQKVTLLSSDPDEPISLGILIDNTSSMGTMPGGTISGVAAATGISRVLLRRLKIQDEVTLMSFSQSFSVMQPFTADRDKMSRSLSRLQTDHGFNGINLSGMNVLAAIPVALSEMKKSHFRKRGLIVMTDAYFGGNLDDVARAVRQAEIPVFAFAMRGADEGLQYPPGRTCSAACHTFGVVPVAPTGGGMRDLTHDFLEMLTKETGGRSVIFEMHHRDTMARVDAAIAEISAELRGQYVLGYYPESPDARGKAIRVRTTRPNNRVYVRREIPGSRP